MIKLAEFTRELPVTFDEFNAQFDKELHYKLTGWNKLMQSVNHFSIIERNSTFIKLIDNGKDLDYLEYYRGYKDKTFVKCSAQISLMYILVAIILCVMLIGFILVPVQLIANILSAKSRVNKIALNSIKLFT